MTVKECRRYLRKWKSTEALLERLRAEKAVLEGDIMDKYELDIIAPDGQPHGNAVTHPTEDKALNIMELVEEFKRRSEDYDRRIARCETILMWVDFAMAIAKHADLLRRLYYDKVPMRAIADEMHVGEATAWRYEADGIRSICSCDRKRA